MTRKKSEQATTVAPLVCQIPEGAARLGIGETKFRELLATGDIASLRIGKSVRIPLSAIDDYITRACQVA